MTGVSVIIPVFNDREALSRAIPATIAALSEFSSSFEVIIAEDGSTDGSADLVTGWAERDPRVRLLHADERQGRGRALTRAISDAREKTAVYYDVDLATDLASLAPLVHAIEGGAAIATGSRLLGESRTARSGGREIASRGYNFLVRTVLGSRIHDHQCGFKAFSRETVLPLLGEVQATHWFWDTEVLVLAQKKGLPVAEIPVRWTEGKGTTVRRQDVFAMGRAVFSLWWRLHG